MPRSTGFSLKARKASSIPIARIIILTIKEKVGMMSIDQNFKRLVLFWNIRYVIIAK